MTYDPNDPNRAFEYPSLENGPPSADPYAPVDYPAANPIFQNPTYQPPQAFPPPYQGYAADPYDPYRAAGPQQGTSGLAIGALVCSLVGLVLCCFFVPSVVGTILGAVAMNDTKRTGQQGHGMAVTGLIVGAVGIAFGIGFWVFAAMAPDTSTRRY